MIHIIMINKYYFVKVISLLDIFTPSDVPDDSFEDV